MFMLIFRDGQVASKKVALPPVHYTRRQSRHRSRSQWMDKMNTAAFSLRSAHYAFRYRGEWHLCNAHGHHQPIRSIPDGPDAKAAAEMWLIHKASG